VLAAATTPDSSMADALMPAEPISADLTPVKELL
jgi:hypothetical protein